MDRQIGGSKLPFDFHPVVHDWGNKDLGMSSRVSVTERIKDPVPLIKKSRVSCPSGRFLTSFIHQVIISRLNKLYDYVLILKTALDADRETST